MRAPMSTGRNKTNWELPYLSPLPDEPAARRKMRVARIAVYALFIGGLVATVIQFQSLTMRNIRKSRQYARENPEASAGRVDMEASAKGALPRWRAAIRQFWSGRNIYAKALPEADPEKTLTSDGEPKVWLHPNMPLIVILLSPMAYLSVPAMAIVWNMLKLAVIVASLLVAVRIANHNGKRMPDWVVALGVAWSILFVIGDIQHANTNVFVLGAIALHLWLYRRGNDLSAGAALALAICLKMTPALFLLYWLYQRNFRLLCGAAFGLIAAMVVPLIAMGVAFGPEHFFLLTGTWLENLIMPGLVKGSWYPIHINQSIPGVLSRYLLGGDNGNIFWNPDDNPASSQRNFGYIHVAVLSTQAVKMIVRLCQLAVVGLAAWAIGWRKLTRDDGRRSLHYALVLLAILLLNQRTWDHHAAMLLISGVAIWYAIAYGRFSRRVRGWAIVLMVAAGPMIWMSGKDTFMLAGRIMGQYNLRVGPEETFTVWGRQVTLGEDKSARLPEIWHDLSEAYGVTFLSFVLMFAACVVLLVAIRKQSQPYADRRQKLFSETE